MAWQLSIYICFKDLIQEFGFLAWLVCAKNIHCAGPASRFDSLEARKMRVIGTTNIFKNGYISRCTAEVN